MAATLLLRLLAVRCRSLLLLKSGEIVAIQLLDGWAELEGCGVMKACFARNDKRIVVLAQRRQGASYVDFVCTGIGRWSELE